MAECKNCGDSGIIHGSTSFCFCKNGNVRLVQHKANMKAREAAKRETEERAAKEACKAEQLELEVKTEPRFKPGDWVEWTSSLISTKGVVLFHGFILGVGKHECRVFPVGTSCNGEMEYSKGFSTNVGTERLNPWELEPVPNPMAVDLALDTNDREWFEQLTKGVKTK